MTIILQTQTPDGSISQIDVTTLREIEQEIARRTGPFHLLDVQNPQPGEAGDVTSDATMVVVPGLRSSVDMGGYEDMFLLRRGRLTDGTLLPADGDFPMPFVADDRIRMVRQYRPEVGVLEVDRPYLYPAYDDEEIELHHMHPRQELRPVALAGLRRCYVVDRVPLGRYARNLFMTQDLTAIAPWITSRDQVYGISMAGGAPMTRWRVEPYGGGLFVRMGEWSIGPAFVTNRRPAVAMVLPQGTLTEDPVTGEPINGWVVRAGNATEAWMDEDRFPVALDYAGAAGHIEAWRIARPRMSLVAQIGMWADQKEAAAEFTRVSTVYFDAPRYADGLPFAGRIMENLSNASPRSAW
jgi:hypothetical protein